MADKRSKSRKGKDTSHVEANEKSTQEASVATERKETRMADNNGVGSIIEFSEDISTAEAPVPLPVGEYPAEIRGAEARTSAKGNRYAAVSFFIAPEAYPADYSEGDPDGQVLVFQRLSLEDSPAARHRLRKFCEAVGAKAGTKIDLNEWVGLSATVSVTHDTYEGETRAAIQKVVAP
jgi:hypothetical protein